MQKKESYWAIGWKSYPWSTINAQRWLEQLKAKKVWEEN